MLFDSKNNNHVKDSVYNLLKSTNHWRGIFYTNFSANM
uniref:Uncharacterized protein n=1 Tax=Arundo donax TaxID=35708 RepID=A0A0A9D6P4_ARUDO